MSAERIINAERAEEDNFKKEICIRLMFCVCAFVAGTGLVSNYSMLVMRITWANDRKNVLVVINEIIMTFSIILNIVAVFLNRSVNYRYRNLRVKKTPENPLAFYLLCLPLFVLTIIGMIPVMYLDISRYGKWKCQDPLYTIVDVSYCFFVTSNFFSVLILLIDISGQYDTGEEWSLNFMNLFTVLITMVSMWIQVIYNLQIKSTDVFGLALYEHLHMKPFQNKNCYSNFSKYFDTPISKMTSFKTESIIMAMIIFTPYLIQPIKRNLRLLLKSTQGEICFEDESRTHRRGPVVSATGIMTSCSLAVVFGTIFIIYLRKDSSSEIIYFTILTLILLVSSIMYFVLVQDIKLWKKRIFTRFFHFNNIILYLGMACDVSTKIINVMIVFRLKINIEKPYEIFHNLCMIGFIFLQTTIVSLIFERNPQRHSINSWNLTLCPILFEIIYNITFFVDDSLNAYSYTGNEDFQVKLSLLGIIHICRPLIYLYKVHIVVTLVGVLAQMYKNKH